MLSIDETIPAWDFVKSWLSVAVAGPRVPSCRATAARRLRHRYGARRHLLPRAAYYGGPAAPAPVAAGPNEVRTLWIGDLQYWMDENQVYGSVASNGEGGPVLQIEGRRVESIDPEMRFTRDELMGSTFVAFGIVLFVGFFYVAGVSKLLPPYENQFLSAIQNDRYYCLLVPLSLPMIIVAVYLHWLNMKMFKHA